MALTAAEQQSLQQLDESLAALLLYSQTLQHPVLQRFCQLLATLQTANRPAEILQAQGRWFHALAEQAVGSVGTLGHTPGLSNTNAPTDPWKDAVLQATLTDTNPFSQQVQHQPLSTLPTALTQAAQQDLAILQKLHDLPLQTPIKWVQQATQYPHTPPEFTTSATEQPKTEQSEIQPPEDWQQLSFFADYYRHQGTGIFGRYRALRWVQGKLQGIATPDPVTLSQLVGYDHPKQLLLQNTERLLNHQPALNVLLYGSRGAGKSSLVKALLNAYGDRGLRLVEVTKAHLIDLPNIVETLRPVPQKFILFVDDLSFEEDDEAFKSLKVVLEGSVTARPQNIVVYATSNRRHLIREFHGDRPQLKDSGEVHQWDTVQEKLSFSDRFGLTLTFEPATQDTFLTIVRHLAAQEQRTDSIEELEFQARRWATRHNGQSGRTARQFIDWLRGEAPLKD